MTSRFSHRLFLSHILLVAVVVLAMIATTDRVLRASFLDTAREELQRQIALGRALYDESTGTSPDPLAREIAALTKYRVTIIAPDGVVLGDSGVGPDQVAELDDHSQRPEVLGALAEGTALTLRMSTSVDLELLYAATLTERGEVLRFAVPIDRIDARVARVRGWLLRIGGGAVLLALLLAIVLSHALSRRLGRMGEIAQAIAAGNLSARVEPEGGDELDDLGHALDGLAEELQRRLEELEAEREEMTTLIDSMAEGILAVAPDGMILRTNPAARTILELPDFLRSVPLQTVIRRAPFLQLARKAARGEAVEPAEVSYEGKHLLVTAEPLPRGGAVLVFLDITELRRLEGVRKDFVANVSHELKTPLTVIRGHGETLLDDDLPDDLRRKFTESVQKNAQRLQDILEDLLDLSRIESGGWRPERTPVDLGDVAREAWQTFATRAEERGVELELRLEPEAREVLADRRGLHQVFSNLFSNALRYTPSGGRIEVRSRRADDGQIAVEVSDTGSGIPSAHLGRIFERFYRVDPARSRAEGGTGLGLSIVRHLVEAHGGRVEVESELDRGTTIRFTLPR